ncbi:hypothetical protein BKA70DRAFT_1226793 [Coprinopsis sp. MPI-PUGE-AT-0042]|nr:hypothetical protein BKA70DRAFT_1226793 [Coprinopsis sp. MPI-PUGE-AT-0042]
MLHKGQRRFVVRCNDSKHYIDKKTKFDGNVVELYYFTNDGYTDNHQHLVLFKTIVIRCMLFSPVSVTPSVLEDPNWKPALNCNSMKWHIKHVTPGLVATAAVIAVFLHKHNKTLAAVGAISKYPYTDAFAYYKEFIMKAFSSEGSACQGIERLFEFYNGIIFPKFMPGDKVDANNADDLKEAMNALGLDDEEV